MGWIDGVCLRKRGYGRKGCAKKLGGDGLGICTFMMTGHLHDDWAVLLGRVMIAEMELELTCVVDKMKLPRWR